MLVVRFDCHQIDSLERVQAALRERDTIVEHEEPPTLHRLALDLIFELVNDVDDLQNVIFSACFGFNAFFFF
jgi:hypothetical protein